MPTESGDQSIALWSSLLPSVDAATIAQLYRKRWHIEGVFGRLESLLHREIKALLEFVAAVLAFNVLALLKQFQAKQCHARVKPRAPVVPRA